jgi:hypothetical protein
MFRETFADKFGFVKEEVEALLSYCNTKASLNTVSEWYDSYSAGGHVSLFNPCSVMQVCAYDTLAPHWVETGTLLYFSLFQHQH